MNVNGKQELERFAMAEIVDVMVNSEGQSYCMVKKSPFNLDEDTINLHEEDRKTTYEKKTFDILFNCSLNCSFSLSSKSLPRNNILLKSSNPLNFLLPTELSKSQVHTP
jgi:hypothetical protein